ncbi:ribokinase [Streptomyces sp. NPDC047981]|uniref:ribokinase n=1 Tax=Streptomyces sp. NPDC047981 TaxID=3154610 RepID=UPI00343C4359
MRFTDLAARTVALAGATADGEASTAGGEASAAGGPRVVVVGSANLDLITEAPELPQSGETVLGTSVRREPGGKGLNQAVAAAAFGARTSLIAAMGDDPSGAVLLDALRRRGVDTTHCRTVPGTDTGTAVVTVDDAGANHIVVIPGANGSLTGLTDADRELIAQADVVLCQLEIPPTTATEAAVTARRHGVPVLVNVSPARDLPPELLEAASVLIVNEHEAAHLRRAEAGIPAGVAILTTFGADGAELAAAGPGGVNGTNGPIRAAAPLADPVDSTGAGDTFAGTFAAATAERSAPALALEVACAAASLSVERPGASASVPTRAETLDRRRSFYLRP